MKLATAAVIAVSPQFGDVHVDGGLVAWDGWRGERYVASVYDVATRRTHELQRIQGLKGGLGLGDLDVAQTGAAVACVRHIPSGTARGGRVLAYRRSSQGVWSRAIRVDAPKRWIDRLRCGVGDAGQISLVWTEGNSGEVLRGAHVSADGTVEPTVTLARNAVDPQVQVAPDGGATVAFRLGREDATVRVAQRPASGGWSVRRVDAGGGPELAMDGTGRALLAWPPWSPDDSTLRLATGPEFAPTPFVSEGNTSLAALEAGSRGDVLAAWTLSAPPARRPRADRWRGPAIPPPVAVQRPGAPFSAPVLLARVAPYPVLAALGADGSGAIAYLAGTGRRLRQVVRVLRPDGSWVAPATLTGGVAGLMPAAPGGFTLATMHPARSGDWTLRVQALEASGGTAPG